MRFMIRTMAYHYPIYSALTGNINPFRNKVTTLFIPYQSRTNLSTVSLHVSSQISSKTEKLTTKDFGYY